MLLFTIVPQIITTYSLCSASLLCVFLAFLLVFLQLFALHFQQFRNVLALSLVLWPVRHLTVTVKIK